MERHAAATWHGGLKDGRGLISTSSSVLSEARYSFGTRFEEARGTNPEELVAAAHAACFSMALSAELETRGQKPLRVHTTAKAALMKDEQGWRVSRIVLETEAEVPGATAEQFEQAAEHAKLNCPISRLLNAEIELHAKLAEPD